MQNHQSPSTYRPIIPAPQSKTYVPTSPFHMSQASPSPHSHSQHGIILPPFETPPDSPFSQALHNDYTGQGAFKLPPPLQPLSPLVLHGSQSMLPPSPTSVIQQQNASPPQSSHSRYERILPKQLVSHSAIERRRRERINDKIMQLKELIPSCADQDHLHKLSILQSSIEYIQYLQDLVITLRKREKDIDKSDNDASLEDGRFIKRSKFDRYEILPPSKSKIFDSSTDKKDFKHKNDLSISPSSSDKILESGNNNLSDSEKLNEDDNISTIKNISGKTKKPLDHEEADALLMLSNPKPKIIMKDSETQTSPTLSSIREWENPPKESKESDDVQEPEKDSPRRGMTVQQLLC
ncbi:5238_t:CDS:2 [Cetraspora pellucida]|uniref:5238_t:CDS:1 n=1 Tax=Cetraspora pellucida TaxID=1433469 RepID=A0ACA9KSN3_9GLOM|nr:5238_t:CDS:2 [Cetraspora pellucida]